MTRTDCEIIKHSKTREKKTSLHYQQTYLTLVMQFEDIKYFPNAIPIQVVLSMQKETHFALPSSLMQ
jgi:hypothetical protein